MYEKIQPHWKHILHAPPPQMLKPEEYLVPFQVFLCEICKYLVPFQVFYVKSESFEKDKNKVNEQLSQSTPIYIRWKLNPNWDIKEAAQQTVCRDQECYRCLGAIVDCPELNITKYKRRLCSLTNIRYSCALW